MGGWVGNQNSLLSERLLTGDWVCTQHCAWPLLLCRTTVAAIIGKRGTCCRCLLAGIRPASQRYNTAIACGLKHIQSYAAPYWVAPHPIELHFVLICFVQCTWTIFYIYLTVRGFDATDRDEEREKGESQKLSSTFSRHLDSLCQQY